MSDTMNTTPSATDAQREDAEAATSKPQGALDALRAFREEEALGTAAVEQMEPTAEASEGEEGDAAATQERARDELGRFTSAQGDDAGEQEAEEVAEGGETTKTEDAEEGEESAFVLALPARRSGDKDVEIEVSGLDAEERERLAQLRNGYMRGEEVRSARAELDEIRDAMAADPVSFLLEHVSPTIRAETAKALLAELMESTEYDQIVEAVNGWDEDDAQRQQYIAERRANRPDPQTARNVREIEQAVRALVAEDTDERVAERFYRAAYGTLMAYVHANEMDTLDPAKVPTLLRTLVEDYDLPPAAQSGPGQDAPSKAVRSVAQAAKKSTGDAEKIAAARAHGQKLVQASARRREVATLVPGGAGITPQRMSSAPVGQTTKERIEWFRKQS